MRRLLLVLTTSLLALITVSTPAQAADVAAGVPSVGTNWAEEGPYDTRVSIHVVHTIYYPDPMGARGETHPVIIWGNGTFVPPAAYTVLLHHYASHGFIVVAANTTQSNFAISMRLGIDVIAGLNDDASSVFYRKVDLEHIGAAGHSQGGSAAINALLDPRVDTAVAIQPGPLNDADLTLGQPILYLAGQYDLIVWPALVKAMYNDANGHNPAIYAEVRGATHFGTGITGGRMTGPSTAWLRAMLLNDPLARQAYFGSSCTFCSDTRQFSDFRRNALARAIAP